MQAVSSEYHLFGHRFFIALLWYAGTTPFDGRDTKALPVKSVILSTVTNSQAGDRPSQGAARRMAPFATASSLHLVVGI
jgi:hypothetical protein